MVSEGENARHERGGAPPAGLQAVLEASPNAIVAVDANGRITYVNPRVEATFGWSPSELIGHHVERLIPER